ncbi:hypothetical protein ABZ566_19970 [Streptomyces hygroscopicus]|uniref:hypothetical protein n=1 Tax=Streptomyces hygroscopicus TaxID=1912 RepID=UPI000767DB21
METLASVPTDRESVRQRWADNNFRRYLGIDPMQIRNHTTGHGDLHWTHLAKTSVVIFDWENSMCGCAWSATDASPRSCRPAPSPSTNRTNTDPRRPRTVHQPNNTRIPGGRNAGADALGREPDPAEWLFFLDNDAPLPRTDASSPGSSPKPSSTPGPHTYSPDWPARTT